VAADDFCYLTTTGRRSGAPHRIEIWYQWAEPDGSTLFLLAGGGRRSDWVRNLVADPRVRIEVDGGAPRPATARVIDDGAEAERARTLVFEKYQPRYDGDLAGWRESALPVAIDLSDDPSGR
jgi:deazaflavin-dependent oxidoreductase (nitroreductase family)